MVSITVPKKYNQKKLDRFIFESFDKLPRSAFYKALRNKDIRINDMKVNEIVVLNTGDRLDIYINDAILYGNIYNPPCFDIVYEDQNLLIVNKKPGILVHADNNSDEITLINMITKYLKNKGECIPEKPDSFAPALCHRLDRNTGGIVIIAKKQEAFNIMLEKIKKREVKKYYKCMVIGCPNPRQAELKHFLFKDQRKSRVYIYETRRPGSVEIITRYRVLKTGLEMSLLEIELITGKTHQIRAHLAYIGHPIVGDGKYGINQFNHKAGIKHQALWAYKVIFDFNESSGILSYLKDMTFEIKNIPFNIKV